MLRNNQNQRNLINPKNNQKNMKFKKKCINLKRKKNIILNQMNQQTLQRQLIFLYQSQRKNRYQKR
jgi:hypothetical protein